MKSQKAFMWCVCVCVCVYNNAAAKICLVFVANDNFPHKKYTDCTIRVCAHTDKRQTSPSQRFYLATILRRPSMSVSLSFPLFCFKEIQ